MNLVKFPAIIIAFLVLTSCSKSGDSPSSNPPIANFTFSAVGTELRAPATINFTSTSTNATSLSWNYGDGGTGVGVSGTHKYLAGGSYNVTLTASGLGGTNTKSQTINVLAAYTQVKITKIYTSSAGSQSGSFTGYYRVTNNTGTTELWKSSNLSFPGTYPVSYVIPTPFVFTNLGATYQIELWKYNTIGSDTKLSNTAFIPSLYNVGNTAADSYPTFIQGVNGFNFDIAWQ